MDSGTEQMNAVIDVYLHHFVAYMQEDWNQLLPMAALHIVGQPADATGVSPFLLTHSWEINTLELFDEAVGDIHHTGPAAQGECIV